MPRALGSHGWSEAEEGQGQIEVLEDPFGADWFWEEIGREKLDIVIFQGKEDEAELKLYRS